MLAERERHMEPKTSQENLRERYSGFPEGLTWKEFSSFQPEIQQQIILRNPVIHTDTYNRTMEHLAGKEWDTPATYALQFRRARQGYLITAGIDDIVTKIANTCITQSQVDFAEEYYQHTKGVTYFNKDKWQSVVDEHDGRLPFEIAAVPDGTAVLPGDPVLRISGPNELVAHFEPDIHRAFYPTLVATNAHEIREKIGPNRFIEVGLRGSETAEKHLAAAKAMYVGGGINLTSSDAAAYMPEFTLVGTLGHRYIQAFEREEDAFRSAIEKLDNVTLLVDLNDTLHGIDMAVDLKKEYRDTDKKIWIRLDSGDVSDQALYALKKQKEQGLLNPAKDKVVVEGIEDAQEMADIDQRLEEEGLSPKDFILYGAGGLLVSSHTSRSDASTGFKITKYGDMETMKFSDTPGKHSIPGEPTLVSINGERIVAQKGEYPDTEDLMVTMYKDGTLLRRPDLQAARKLADASYEEVKSAAEKGEKSSYSGRTEELVTKIQRRTTEAVVVFEEALVSPKGT